MAHAVDWPNADSSSGDMYMDREVNCIATDLASMMVANGYLAVKDHVPLAEVVVSGNAVVALDSGKWTLSSVGGEVADLVGVHVIYDLLLTIP